MSQVIAIDDFDPLIGYSNYDDWQTPDPQDHPTWYNETRDVTGVAWYEGVYDPVASGPTDTDAATYHYTTVQGATFYFNFTGMLVRQRSSLT